jgi:hypothetical protein
MCSGNEWQFAFFYEPLLVIYSILVPVQVKEEVCGCCLFIGSMECGVWITLTAAGDDELVQFECGRV